MVARTVDHGVDDAGADAGGAVGAELLRGQRHLLGDVVLAAEAVAAEIADDDKGDGLIVEHRDRRGGGVVRVRGAALGAHDPLGRVAILVVDHPPPMYSPSASVRMVS